MRPISAYLSTQKLILLVAAFFTLSALISAAAVVRGGGRPVSFYAQQIKEYTSLGKEPPSPQRNPPSALEPTPELGLEPAPEPTPEPAPLGPEPAPELAPALEPAPEQVAGSEPEPALELAPEYKYFHEAGDNFALAHYDARFYQGRIPYSQHRTALTHLIRSYLTTFDALRLPTWLAHGTLLGWWWSGRILPWDADVDAQVSGRTLGRMLARGWNQSLHVYEYEDESEFEDECGGGDGGGCDGGREGDGGEGGGGNGDGGDGDGGDGGDGNGDGLAAIVDHGGGEEGGGGGGGGGNNRSEIAPIVGEDGENQQQQRRTRQREYFLDINTFATQTTRSGGKNVIDARWIDVETGMFVDITVLMERDPEGKPGIWTCKNFHGYRPEEELFPLLETEFEGVPALVPWGYQSMLVEEYGASALAFTEWVGHRWEPELGLWVKMTKTEGETNNKTEGKMDGVVEGEGERSNGTETDLNNGAETGKVDAASVTGH